MNSAPVAVILAGSAVGPFGRHADTTLPQLVAPVIAEALAAAAVEPGQIEAAFVGNAFGGALCGQESILGQVLLAPARVAGVPLHTVKNACSSGSDAVHLAWSAIAYGQYDCVLVAGAEKLHHPERERAFAALATATDRVPEQPGRSVFMDVNAERAHAYMRRYGAGPRVFALAAAKNRAHAALNDKAAVRAPITADEILRDRIVVEPLTRSMCGGLCDGAAALVLCSEAFARRRGLAAPRIAASVSLGGDAQGHPEGTPTRRAALRAFAQSGVDPRDISLAEVHDPTSPQELFDIEEIGLAPPGGAIALTEDGATALGGRLPVNVSGGLIARGHPVGATGVAQLAELAEQLQGRAGRRQVENPRSGLAQMAGGLFGRESAVATIHILTV
jgi:acetyl-CoA acetyltransferase